MWPLPILPGFWNSFQSGFSPAPSTEIHLSSPLTPSLLISTGNYNSLWLYPLIYCLLILTTLHLVRVSLSLFVWNIDYFFSICFSLYSLPFQTLLVECPWVQVLDSFCSFTPTSQVSISSLMANSPFCVLTLPKFNPPAQASTLQNPFSRKSLDILIWMSDKSLNLSRAKVLLFPFIPQTLPPIAFPFSDFQILSPKMWSPLCLCSFIFHSKGLSKFCWLYFQNACWIQPLSYCSQTGLNSHHTLPE